MQIHYQGVEVRDRLTVDSAGELRLGVVSSVRLDRASTQSALETSLPRGSSLTWRDDFRVDVLVPSGAGFTLRLDGARSGDGRPIDSVPLSIQRIEREIAIFEAEEIAAGRASPAATVMVPLRVSRLGFGPEKDVAIVDPSGMKDSLTFLDLSTGGRQTIALPEGMTWYSYTGWLADGRLLIAGQKLWIGDKRGAGLSALGSGGQLVAPSPAGQHIAAWSADTGQVSVMSMQSRVAAVIARAPSCGGGTGPRLSWMPDSSAIALSVDDCGTPGTPAVTRIVDLQGRVTAEIKDARVLACLGPAELVVTRSSGGPAGTRVAIIDLAGNERLVPGESVSLSPDRRFIGYTAGNGTASRSGLYEVRTGRTYSFISGFQVLGWSSATRVVLVKNPT